MNETDLSAMIQNRAKALQLEIEHWFALAQNATINASKTNDTTNLRLLEVFLRSGRQSIAQVIGEADSRDYAISPIMMSDEITLPSFPLPGDGVRVKARNGTARLPSQGWIPEQ